MMGEIHRRILQMRLDSSFSSLLPYSPVHALTILWSVLRETGLRLLLPPHHL
ncbi:hypothetical protein RchiOBHm_Chr7g0237811 [Rosa chinensis]|uniref:Uncharacterized protein n=1 Tax=Rosa chinensis TaxID=74649 RepID=A0A2P6PHA1_ROSCH|nr:hypothetical protein RchiOBHm_Chr7g0237811 [Rosa chinensis]